MEYEFQLTQKEAFLILEKVVCAENFGSGSYSTNTTAHVTANKVVDVTDVSFTIAVSTTTQEGE